MPSCELAVVLLLVPFIFLFSSCEKNPGTGGTGSISGTIIERFYNDDFSSQLYERVAVDEEIFMLYGEDNALGDREFTDLTGKFRFNYLFPGRYYVYYLSQDSTSILDEQQEKLYLVDLKRGEEVDLGDLEKLTTLDYDDGAAMIKGVVWVEKYVDESRWPKLVTEYIAPAQEQEVYITYGNHTFYDDRIRTQDDGYFEFSKLIPGDYRIFLYSDDVTRVKDNVVLEFQVTISEFDQVVDLGEITIEQL